MKRGVGCKSFGVGEMADIFIPVEISLEENMV